MRGLNRVQLIGSLGKDPEAKYTTSGLQIAEFSVATNEDYKKDGELISHTEWHRVTAFGKLAEIVIEFCQKGTMVYVEGKIRTKEFEKEGVKRYYTSILADSVLALRNSKQSAQSKPPRSAGFPGSPPADDNIPF